MLEKLTKRSNMEMQAELVMDMAAGQIVEVDPELAEYMGASEDSGMTWQELANADYFPDGVFDPELVEEGQTNG